jgi:hypothetical protein
VAEDEHVLPSPPVIVFVPRRPKKRSSASPPIRTSFAAPPRKDRTGVKARSSSLNWPTPKPSTLMLSDVIGPKLAETVCQIEFRVASPVRSTSAAPA